jgi:hypothetical protein
MKHTAALIALIAMLAAQLVSAPPPKLIREIDLSQLIPGRPGYKPSTTFAFSPDEKWLAVTFSAHQAGPHGRGNIGQSGSEKVLLVPVKGPADQQVQIDPGLLSSGNPGWSPNSDAFFLQGLAPDAQSPRTEGTLKVWNLRGEELLHRDGVVWLNVGPLRGMFGFVDPEHLLGRADSTRKPHEFEILDLHGQVVDTWTAPKQWRVVDTSPDRHLLAVLSNERASQTLVVDYPSKKVILSKDNPYQEIGTGQIASFSDFFTEGGRTLCSVGSVEFQPARKDTFTQCWDVDSGKKIAQFDAFLGGAPAAASSHGSRLVLTSGVLFTKKDGLKVASYGQRVVWDFRSGTQVAAWDMPGFSWSGISHPPELLRPVPAAISSSGRYAAEADGVLLRIYELP